MPTVAFSAGTYVSDWFFSGAQKEIRTYAAAAAGARVAGAFARARAAVAGAGRHLDRFVGGF